MFTGGWFIRVSCWSEVGVHVLTKYPLISVIRQIPFCSFGRNIILVPPRESHYEYCFQGWLGLLFQFRLPLCSQMSHLFVYRQLLRWLNVPPGIDEGNRVSSWLILSVILKIPSGCYRPAANKLLVSWCLLAHLQYLFCIFLSANTDTFAEACWLWQWRAEAE